MQITITQKDIEKNKICNSPSGELIDELAYSAGEWTSEDLWGQNFDYEPSKPYSFNYEADLFEATKTLTQLQGLANSLDISINEGLFSGMNLQAGAYCALHMPEKWQELLTAYTEKLDEDGVDGISKAYNKELQDEKDSFNEDLYQEWLYGDHRNYNGVVYEISKYFTEERDGSYDKKSGEYTFTLGEEDIQNYKDAGYKKNQIKGALIDEIRSAGNARNQKEKVEMEKRKAERERLAIYKKEQADKAEAERKAKLLAMTL